jgi:hypothetical protein
MVDLLKVIAGLFLLVLALLPAILIAFSSIKLKRLLGGLSSYAILAAGILLTLQSLDFLLPMFFTLVLKMSPEEYAKSSVILAYVKVAVNYIALLLLGVGLLGQSKRFKAVLANNA